MGCQLVVSKPARKRSGRKTQGNAAQQPGPDEDHERISKRTGSAVWLPWNKVVETFGHSDLRQCVQGGVKKEQLPLRPERLAIERPCEDQRNHERDDKSKRAAGNQQERGPGSRDPQARRCHACERQVHGRGPERKPRIWQSRMAGANRPAASTEEYSHKSRRGMVKSGWLTSRCRHVVYAN